MPASTLLSMAQRAGTRALPSITDVADIPYHLLRPILLAITNPTQLHNLEIASPALADHTAELWRAFIARDVTSSDSQQSNNLLSIEPKNPRSWWKVYRKLAREEQQRREAQEAVLRETMSGLHAQREAKQAIFVAKVLPSERKERSVFVDGVLRASLVPQSSDAAVAFRKAKKQKQVMAGFRRQAGEEQRNRALVMDRKTVASARAQITRAPESMMMDHRKLPPVVVSSTRGKNAEGRRMPVIFAAGKNTPTAPDRAIDEALGARNADRERRLLALTQPASKAKPVTSAVLKAAVAPSARAFSPPLTKVVLSPTVDVPPTTKGVPPLAKSVSPASITPRDARLAIDSNAKTRSPSPLPAVARKRPAPAAASVFMPAKKKTKVF